MNAVVDTMAFSGYSDRQLALRVMLRVLAPGTKFVMHEVNCPQNGNWLGMLLVWFWAANGNSMREIMPLFEALKTRYVGTEVDGFGSVHLYVVEKP